VELFVARSELRVDRRQGPTDTFQAERE
jgi:hypothetical protein